MKKRLIALFMCGILFVSTLAGCGKVPANTESTPEATSATKETNEPKETEATTTEPVVEEFDPRSITEGVTLRIAVPMQTTVIDYETNEMTLAIEEALGVDLVFDVYASETYVEKMNVMINGGDKLPDIIINGGDSNAAAWADAGAIIDVAEYFANPDYAKNMYAFMELTGHDVVGMAKTLEGNIWGYPFYSTALEGAVAFNLMIDEEWAKAVGFDEMPATTDEFLALCRAFKAAGDVNGNGEDDEIALSGQKNLNWFKGLMTSFVYAWGHKYLLSDGGDLYYAYTTDEWKEGLKYIRIFFEEGLIDSGAFTNASKEYRAINRDADGRLLADFFNWVLANDSGAVDFNYAKQADWVKPIFLTSPVNDKVYSCYTPKKPEVRNFITTDCENPLAAFLVMDFMASDEMSRINRVGKQGERWEYWGDIPDEWFAERGTTRDQFEVVVGTKDDGVNFAYEYAGLITEAQNASWDYIGPILYNDIGISRVFDASNKDAYEYEKRRLLANETAAENLPGDIFVASFDVEMTIEEADQIADMVAALDGYVTESISSFLLGTWDIDDYWDTYLAELDKIGIDKVLEMYQAAYDRQN